MKNNAPRYLQSWVISDLKKKMVFIAGPRQTGKTTLALHVLGGNISHAAYFNWDNDRDRKKLIRSEFPAHEPLIILDEIHKYRRWRNWIKGNYDKLKSNLNFLVTGSARLDYYRRGGDSLQGRYHFYRLHPFSLAELTVDDIGRRVFSPYMDIEKFTPSSKNSPQALHHLLTFGGFPEPLFQASEREARRWRMSYIARILKEDLKDLENISDVALIELLIDRLPDCVGNPLSINALREDLEVAHKTVSRWLKIIENLYIGFRIYPFGSPKIRAVKKEAKMYLWDWCRNNDTGSRFENLMASHLLKFCHYIEDTQGYPMELRYIRDTDKREVDFLVLLNQKPWFGVETKTSDDKLSPHVAYFSKRLKVPFWYQVVLNSDKDVKVDQAIRIMPAWKFLSCLI